MSAKCGTTIEQIKELFKKEIKMIRSENRKLLRAKDTELSNLRRDKNNEITELTRAKDNEIAYLRKELSNYREELASLKTATNNHTYNNNRITITTGQIMKLLPEYSTAAPLSRLTDMSQIFNEHADNFLMDIVYDHRNNILHESIGNSIIELYKKVNPQRQAIWTTDTSRQNYILLIENAIGKTKVNWITDKNGIHVKDKIIDPILVYLKAKLDNYVPTKDQKSMEAKGVMLGVIKEINDGGLSRKINKYITSHFYMTDDVKKAITHKKKPMKRLE